MAIGLGIILLLLGLILLFNVVHFNLTFVDDHALGLILVVVGILAIVLSLIVNQQRTRRTQVVEERREI